MGDANNEPFGLLEPLKYALKAFVTQWRLALSFALFLTLMFLLNVFLLKSNFIFFIVVTIFIAYELIEAALRLYDAGTVQLKKFLFGSRSYYTLGTSRGTLMGLKLAACTPLMYLPELTLLGLDWYFTDVDMSGGSAAIKALMFVFLLLWTRITLIVPAMIDKECSLISAIKESYRLTALSLSLLRSIYFTRLITFALIYRSIRYYYENNFLLSYNPSSIVIVPSSIVIVPSWIEIVILLFISMTYIWIISFAETFIYKKLIEYHEHDTPKAQ